jgi:hypothetical protein
LGPGIDNVVGHYEYSLMNNDVPVKIMQNEESGEKEPVTPEGIRNPGIQVIIRPGRRVIGDYGWASVIIIIIDYLRRGIRPVVIGRVMI